MSSDDDFDDDDDDIFGVLDAHPRKSPMNPNPYHQNQYHTPNTSAISRETPPARYLHESAAHSQVAPTQVPSTQTNTQKDLYTARGEIAILRAQLKQLETSKIQEIQRLKELNQSTKQNNDEQIQSLQNVVGKLEDEKKFLSNEVRNISSRKKRKKNHHDISMDGDSEMNMSFNQTPVQPVIQQTVLKSIPNEPLMFTDQMLDHCICGSSRTTMDYLSKISVSFKFSYESFFITKNESIASAISRYLTNRRNLLRLDDLIEEFVMILITFMNHIFHQKYTLSIPFLISLIHYSINFRPSATKKVIIEELINVISTICIEFLPNFKQKLFENKNETKLKQYIVLENFLLVCSSDLLEDLVNLGSFHEISNIEILPEPYIKSCLTNQTPINLIFNIVEMLISLLDENAWGPLKELSDIKVIEGLIKLLSDEIPIKENFMYFGTNRIIGNNFDYRKLDALVPLTETILGSKLTKIPLPISYEILSQKYTTDMDPQLKFEIESNHENHCLNLRIRILKLIENYTVLNGIEIFGKTIMRDLIWCIGKEQENILKAPRSDFVNLRCQIISYLVKIVYTIIKTKTEIISVLTSDTLQELNVVFTRISFSSNKLSAEAADFISRSKHLNCNYLFNEKIETNLKNLYNLNEHSNINKMIEIESEFTNGVEFPYEYNIIELSREILEMCLTIEEGDNCYLNMNVPIEVDEMDYLDD